jgi:hypothetical protein
MNAVFLCFTSNFKYVKQKLDYIQKEQRGEMCVHPFRYGKIEITPNTIIKTRNAAIIRKETALENSGKFPRHSKFLEN